MTYSYTAAFFAALRSSLFRPSLILVVLFSIPACAWVKPWQKEDLERLEMGVVVDRLERQLNLELGASREGAASTPGQQGPGCGCN